MVKQTLAEAIKEQLAERTYTGPATIDVKCWSGSWQVTIKRTGAITGKIRTWSAEGYTARQAIGRALECAVYWETEGKILLLPMLKRDELESPIPRVEHVTSFGA